MKPGRTILASTISKPYTEEIEKKVEQLRPIRPQGPLLVGFLANEDPAAKMYATWTVSYTHLDVYKRQDVKMAVSGQY